VKLLFIGGVLFSSFVRLAPAQESISYASVSGQVTDPSGAAVAGARVNAQQAETNHIDATETDREGRFHFSYLRAGPYRITVQKSGFAEATRLLTMPAGSAFDLPVQLALESESSSVTVSGEAAVLDTARTQISRAVSGTEIRALPLNGRNFLDLTMLVPGVSPTNTGSNQLFPETSAVPGQGISVASQRNFSNNFLVDGLSANDDAAGLTGAFYGLGAISELHVVTSGGQAEFGRALGGSVNIVTKSGTNILHGDLYGYFRNSRLNAANALSHAVLPLTQAQYGASLGGPVVRDRTFYFVNFEQRELNQAGLITISPENVAAINARLEAVKYPGRRIFTGLYPNPVHTANLFGRLDRQFGTADQFGIRYSFYRVHSENSRGAGGLSASSASADLNDADHTIAVSNIAPISSRLVNETRGEFTRSNLAAPPSDPIGPAVSISGVASFGTLSGSPTARLNDLYEIADNLSYQSGAHAIRVGADWVYNDDAITYPRSIRGSYSFSSLANFLNGIYNNPGFTQTFRVSRVSQTNPNLGVYAQDEWKPLPGLTLNLGLRYDLQFLETIATDTNNVSPRAGIAWSPLASRTTVIRASAGLFYDRVPLRALANALLSAGNTTDPEKLRQISISLSPAQTGAPVFPNILSSLTLPPGVRFNFTTMDRHMQNAYSEQGGLEVERQIGRDSTVSVGYQHLRGVHLILSVNQNVPACVASGDNNGCRPNPNFANNSQYSPRADSQYDGFYVSWTHRPARWGGFRLSYSWSKAFDNVGEFFFSSPIDNYNIWEDYGRSDDDQRYRLVFFGVLRSPADNARTLWQKASHGFQISGMLQYYSALPLNIVTGTTTIQGSPARPLVNGAFLKRNAGSGFDFFNVNARLERTFVAGSRLRVETIAEAFNLLNHLNGITLNGTFGTGSYPNNPSPSFRQITAVADPRTVQLALRLRF
jgi:hypothetical protein